MPIYKFKNCLLDTRARVLTINGRVANLTTRAFDVLQFLVERRGKVVTKDDILGVVWNGSFVEEGNLPVHISRIRKLLGRERFVETVYGIGYRFTASTTVVADDLGFFATNAVRERIATRRFQVRHGSVIVNIEVVENPTAENDNGGGVNRQRTAINR